MTRCARIETNEGDIGALLSVIGTKQTYEAQSMVRSGAHSGRSLIQCLLRRAERKYAQSAIEYVSDPQVEPFACLFGRSQRRAEKAKKIQIYGKKATTAVLLEKLERF